MYIIYIITTVHFTIIDQQQISYSDMLSLLTILYTLRYRSVTYNGPRASRVRQLCHASRDEADPTSQHERVLVLGRSAAPIQSGLRPVSSARGRRVAATDDDNRRVYVGRLAGHVRWADVGRVGALPDGFGRLVRFHDDADDAGAPQRRLRLPTRSTTDHGPGDQLRAEHAQSAPPPVPSELTRHPGDDVFVARVERRHDGSTDSAALRLDEETGVPITARQRSVACLRIYTCSVGPTTIKDEIIAYSNQTITAKIR